MNLAVKLYQDVDPNDPNVLAGIPLIWPAECVELGNKKTLPPGPYILMTDIEFAQYKQANQAAFDAWQQPIKQKQSADEQQVQQAAAAIDISQIVLQQLHITLQQFDVPTSAQLLTDLLTYLSYLNCGLYKYAASYVSTLIDKQGLLDKQADPLDPKKGTLRVFLMNIV